MCGIYGVWDRQREPILPATWHSMAACIAHRGPDESGAHEAPGVVIGNQRLSIIDISSGKQPFVSDDGQIAVVQNGEIYNYVELRAELQAQGVQFRTSSDTEVLLRLYEAHGPTFWSRLNGMFAVAIYDARTDELHLARDRMGVKPLYIADDGQRIWFGSEIKVILQAGFPRRVDPEALHHYFSFLFVPPPLTMFQGIRHVPPGHAVRITRQGMETHAWWRLSDIQCGPEPDLDEWCEQFRYRLSEGVRLRMRADVPFGAFLSGGLDSSSVVHSMCAHSDHPVQTFSIGFDDPRFDEGPFSQQVADMFGTDHTLERVDPNMIGLWPLVVWHCDQPHSDVSYMPMYRVSELAVRRVKMVLTGDGGDELFGGYQRYADFFSRPEVADYSAGQFSQAYHDSMALLTEADKRTYYSADLARQTQGLDSHAITAGLFAEVPDYDRMNQALYLDCRLLLPGNNLVKPDRMPMAVSLEARDPFLDPALIDLAFQTPGSFKVRDGVTRWAYKHAVQPFLGADLTHRKKQMFTVPIGEWFKRELRTWTPDFLLSDRTLSRGLFQREALAQMLDDHANDRANHTRLIRSFVALEMWHRMFIDECFVSAPTMADLGAPEPELV